MPLPILIILKRYWKPLVLLVAVLAVVGYIYGRGKSSGRAQVWNQLEKVVKSRVKQEDKVRKRYRDVKDKIEKSRSTSPQNDERDSCILSNDPGSGACDQYL